MNTTAQGTVKIHHADKAHQNPRGFLNCRLFVYQITSMKYLIDNSITKAGCLCVCDEIGSVSAEFRSRIRHT